LSNFRKARTTAKRTEAARQVVRTGPEGAKALLAVIDEELREPLAAYREAFATQSTEMLTAHGIDLGEVAKLRAAVIARAQEPNLSEGSIRGDSDAAIARLNMLLVGDRLQVLQSDPALKKQRLELMSYGPAWEACQTALGPEATASGERGSFDALLAGEETMTAQFALSAPFEA
jgi:hypothetical protein